MVPNTSDDLPDPETPVNTVSRRLGISTLTSFRLFTRAPWTRIRSWRSAGCRPGDSVRLFILSIIEKSERIPRASRGNRGSRDHGPEASVGQPGSRHEGG